METDAELASKLLEHFRHIQDGKTHSVYDQDGVSVIRYRVHDEEFSRLHRLIERFQNNPTKLARYREMLASKLANNETLKELKLADKFDTQLTVEIVRRLRSEMSKIKSSRCVPKSEIFEADNIKISHENMRKIVDTVYAVDLQKDKVEIYVARSFEENTRRFATYSLIPGCQRNAKGRAVCGQCGKICFPSAWEKHLKCWVVALRL